MVKNVEHKVPPKTEKTYLSLRLLFVIIWFVLVMLLTSSNLFYALLRQSSTDVNNLITSIILLVPIAIVIFPMMYRLGDFYSISEKRKHISTLSRNMLSIFGTIILLGVILYLFTIISFALFYRF